MEDFDWNYIWVALVINALLILVLPRVFKKPTGIKPVDETILFLNSQKSFLVQSSIVLAVVVYASHYWLNSESHAPVHVKPFSQK
jgi:hypothetical protein